MAERKVTLTDGYKVVALSRIKDTHTFIGRVTVEVPAAEFLMILYNTKKYKAFVSIAQDIFSYYMFPSLILITP